MLGRPSIQARLLISFLVLSALGAGVGLIAVRALDRVTGALGTHIPREARVAKATAQLGERAALIKYYDEVLTQSARNYAFTGEDKWKTRYLANAPKLDVTLAAAIAHADERDRRSFSAIDAANEALVELETRAIASVDAGDQAAAIRTLESDAYWDNKRQYASLLQEYTQRREAESRHAVQGMIDEIERASISAFENAVTSKQLINQGALMIAVAILIFALAFIRPIGPRLRELEHVVADVARGNLGRRVGTRARDEIGVLASAIDEMIASLEQSHERMQNQDWLKTGVARVSDVMRGVDALPVLANEVIAAVCAHLDAELGVLYVLDDTATKPLLTLLGSYGYTESRRTPTSFELGEGLVGQAGKELRQLVVTDVPKGYIRVVSGLGDAEPRCICVTPLVYEGKLKGAIEIGTLGELTDAQRKFLEQVTPAIAVALEAVSSSSRLAEALEHAHELAEQLQRQQTDLQASNEELEEQTQALQASEEQLRSQQEELTVINEELEERNHALALQKREVEVARAELAEQASQVELASRYKSEFLANMSHELRTPLNSLLLLARSLAENKQGNLTPPQVESANVIYNAGTDLLTLIGDILDLSKIEAGRMDVSVSRVTLDDLSAGTRATFHHVASDAGLDLKVVVDPAAPTSIVTDPGKLKQVLKNLISNAIKFTEEGSVTVRFAPPPPGVDLSQSGLDPENTVMISVADTGIGIDARHLGVIFEAFRQADGTLSRRHGGTGLGLSISRELVTLLGGEIQVQSEPSMGSTFTVFIPRALRPQPAPADQLNRSDAPTMEFERTPSLRALRPSIPDDRRSLTSADRTILIIEDDAVFAKALVGSCHEAGLKCLVALSGEDGLVLADQHRPDAIILDIYLPGIDGWRVLEQLKENTKTRHIPVHVMSAEPPSTKAVRMGAIGHLHKPVTPDSLRDALEKIEEVTSDRVKRILVVEDDDEARRAIADLVGGKDVHVEQASTATEAIEAVRQRRFDCMILDLGLWDMDGEKVLRAIESDPSAVLPPVVVYTGRDLSRAEEERLRKYTESIIIKDARSEDRLLDEVSLFLHRVISDMPPNKRQVIVHLHDQEAVLRGKKVLIAEDDMRSAFALGGLLTDRGMQVLKAENGEVALRRLEEQPDVDIVLMDMMMPIMDGYQAMRAIRDQPRFAKLPIIALTAKAMKDDAARCMAAGASDYLTKPLDEQRLLSVLRVWLYG